jgi:hydroxyacylglutathione hydrolase
MIGKVKSKSGAYDPMGLIIDQFMCLSDNFGVLIRDEASGRVAAIDAPEEAPIRAALKRLGWRLDEIIVTHHHHDHTDGIAGLKAEFGALVTAPAAEADKIPGVDRTVKEGDRIALGDTPIEVLETPGHTLGHVSYVIPTAHVAFVGDTLFSIGCGRLLEGTPAMMWRSLKKLAALPRETRIYCGHEYTESNVRFALTVEPNNIDLEGRAEEVKALRAAGKPTLPVTIGDELAANPFLRADHPRLRRALGMADAPAEDVFAEIRKRKDNFR